MAQYQIITPMFLSQKALATGVATLYTSPNAVLTTILEIDVVNTTGSSATFDVYLVPPTGTAGTGNALFYNNTLASKTSFQWKGSIVLSAGWTIQALSSVTGLTINISGQQAV